MAKYGARESFWAPWAEGVEDTDAAKLPKYGEKKTFGQLNKVTDTPNFNEGSLPGDDQIALYEKGFKDGTVDAESVFLPMADAAVMLGAAHDKENGLAHGDDDTPPYIGYGFLTHHVGKTGKYFQVVFIPSSRPAPPLKPMRPEATTSTSQQTRCPSIGSLLPVGNTRSSRISLRWKQRRHSAMVCLTALLPFPVWLLQADNSLPWAEKPRASEVIT